MNHKITNVKAAQVLQKIGRPNKSPSPHMPLELTHKRTLNNTI